ncbi:MAG: RNA 2',3'-cyclic phosphodiesterase [Anaerolineae bacterium]|nr:RNA 2',3'-cyclic phosphodiesterase [Anaerolineae bacterium]
MRAFLALVPDSSALEVLRAYQRVLMRERWAEQVKWVSAQHWHLTLRFLGEITDTQRLQLARQLNVALREQRIQSVRVRFSQPQFFPSPRQPRVIACLVESTPLLQQLAELAEASAQRIGLPPERKPFKGHITLGRTRGDFPLNVALPFDEARSPFVANTVVLFKSDLTPSGPIYTTLDVFPL